MNEVLYLFLQLLYGEVNWVTAPLCEKNMAEREGLESVLRFGDYYIGE